MWLSTYHLSSNLIWFDLLYFIRRSSGPPICLFLYLSSPVLSCPILSYMSFRSCDMCIYLVIYRFPFFFYIFIEFKSIDRSIRLSTTLHSWYSPLHYTGQAEMDALATSIGMEKKSEAYGLVHSALAEREVQKVLETRWFYCSTCLFYFKWHFIP